MLPNLESIGSLAIVGASGLVGQEILSILSERKIKLPQVRLLASEHSAGLRLEVGGERVSVEPLTENSFENIEVAVFSAPKAVTQKYVPLAVEAGALVIDDSSSYRLRPDVGLIVPEVNGNVLRDFEGRILSTPNCTTTPIAMALKPLLDAFGLKRVIVSTYQSVSGAGKKANEELSRQCASLLNGQGVEPGVFPHQLAFNCIPKIGGLLENGYTEEEQKVAGELRKILGVSDLKVSATAVRVPTFIGHGSSVHVELERDFGSVDEIRELFSTFSGIMVLDKVEADIYPTNLQAGGADSVFVGRIRRDTSIASGIVFWTMTDNLRKGAALNILQILSTLYGYRLMN